MPDRTVLCIDPDAATVAEIRRVLSPHGLTIESIANGEQAIEWARAHLPWLIILSVEPRKTGYAICNKLRRSPSLREVPLILMSSEETLATFEQHKKLKSRADEYILKPLDRAELWTKVQRLVSASEGAEGDAEEEIEEIELDDDEMAEVSLDEEEGLVEESFGGTQPHTTETGRPPVSAAEEPAADDAPAPDEPLDRLGDLSRPSLADAQAPSPFTDSASGPTGDGQVTFDVEQFDKETQDAFAALEAGAAEGRTPEPAIPVSAPVTGARAHDSGPSGFEVSPHTQQVAASDVVDLQTMWSENDLQQTMPWDSGPVAVPAASEITDQVGEPPAGLGNGHARGSEPPAGSVSLMGSSIPDIIEDPLLAGLGNEEVPPLPEDVLYDDRHRAEVGARDQRITELHAQITDLEARLEQEKRASDGKTSELQGRITSLETERQTLRREMDEQRDAMTHAANQGAFSKERDLLNLRGIINRKEKDILDLRDGLDAKERLILDHKDKIRELERAQRDLDERTLNFERNLIAANEKVQELAQDREKSVEREKGLKARLDDAHEELRKGQDEIEAMRKRTAQDVERVRAEGEKMRVDLEAKLGDLEESRRAGLEKAADEWAQADAARKAAHQGELSRMEVAHRAEVEGLQKRLGEELAAAAERLQSEMFRLRREHEKAIAGQKEEQALQLTSERQAYETQTEAKHRAYRDEVLGLRRRHEEELAAAEDRRQRDILEQEQRRVAELEQAETRRRVELQARDEEHHARLTESERRHLIEKSESGERHRTEHDQALGRAARAEGELAARAQELDQAYRRLAGFEADLDAARAEISDRDVKLGQARDRLNELETKVTDYEDQIVRAFQRLRADEKTTEKIRRALGVALALLDDRGVPQASAMGKGPVAPAEEAEKS